MTDNDKLMHDLLKLPRDTMDDATKDALLVSVEWLCERKHLPKAADVRGILKPAALLNQRKE